MPVLKSKEGRLYEVAPEEVATLQRDQGWTEAAPEEVARRTAEREQYARYGSTGQQALGLAETFARNATLGAVKGLTGDDAAARGRAQVTSEESPVLYGAAGLAPAAIAGVATGGAGLGLAGTVAAEGLLGGLGGVGSAADEAFKEDQDLSAEAALGSFGTGFLLGGALGGAAYGGGKLLGAARNRFVEASGAAARRAEKEAFEQAGIRAPGKGLAEAVADPAKAAKIRAKGQEAIPEARAGFQKGLADLEAAETAARARGVPGAAPEGDPAVQRAAIRNALGSLRTRVTSLGAGEEVTGAVGRIFDSLDRAESAADLFTLTSMARRTVDGAADAAADPALAKALSAASKRLRELEESKPLFGAAGEGAAASNQALSDLADARTALQQALGQGDYFANVGTRRAAAVDEALDTYLERLGAVEGVDKAAIGRMRALRSDLEPVAAMNQVDALSATADAGGRPTGMLGELGQDIAEDAVSAMIPGGGLLRKAWKYRKHIARLAGMAKEDSEGVANSLVRPRAKGALARSRARARQSQSGHVAIGRGGNWHPVSEVDRHVDDAIRLFEDDEALAELSPAELRGRIHDTAEQAWVDAHPDADEIPREVAKALKTSTKQAFADLPRIKADRAAAKAAVDSERRAMSARLAESLPEATDLLRSDPSGASLRERFGGIDANHMINDLVESGAVIRHPAVPGRGSRYYVADDAAVRGALARSRARAAEGGMVDIRSGFPIKDVRVPDAEGYLEAATPKQLAKHAGDIRKAAETALSGKSLDDLRALPLEEGPGAAASRAKVEAFKADAGFRKTGMLPSNNDRGRGGLPAFNFYPGDGWTLQNGRHRMTAALESGQEYIVANLKKYDKQGNPIWDYVGPVRVGKAKPTGRGAERGFVSAGQGPNFSLGDVAKSPMGVVTGAGGAAFAASRILDSARYSEYVDSIKTLAKEPWRLADALSQSLGDMADDAPELVMQLNARAMGVVSFLQSKLPPSIGFSLMYPDGPPPSKQDVVTMGLYINGATNPRGVLASIADESVMPEEVEAFKATYPTWFGKLQRDTHTAVALANQNGDPVPASRIAQLELVLDMPGQLDPTFGDQVATIARGQMLAAKEAQQAPSYTPAPQAGARIAPTGAQQT